MKVVVPMHIDVKIDCGGQGGGTERDENENEMDVFVSVTAILR